MNVHTATAFNVSTESAGKLFSFFFAFFQRAHQSAQQLGPNPMPKSRTKPTQTTKPTKKHRQSKQPKAKRTPKPKPKPKSRKISNSNDVSTARRAPIDVLSFAHLPTYRATKCHKLQCRRAIEFSFPPPAWRSARYMYTNYLITWLEFAKLNVIPSSPRLFVCLLLAVLCCYGGYCHCDCS
jgi:hypothetical protein